MQSRLTLEEAKQKLRIDRNNIDEAILDQSVLFYEVSNNLVLAKQEKDMLKDRMENEAAEISNFKRIQFEKDKKKFTEHALKEEVFLDEDYLKIKNEYNEIYSDLRKWETMKEAYIQRSFMLRELARLWALNYYGDTSLSGGSEIKKNIGEIGRERLSKTREQRKGLKRTVLNNQ